VCSRCRSQGPLSGSAQRATARAIAGSDALPALCGLTPSSVPPLALVTHGDADGGAIGGADDGDDERRSPAGGWFDAPFRRPSQVAEQLSAVDRAEARAALTSSASFARSFTPFLKSELPCTL